eukprot:Transcript_30211.p1 GENE.Transcript_30211~~Transcript_30211.p1  ORF type:complete len:433 (+),score=157.46 Transcript_30211:71-1300(+)
MPSNSKKRAREEARPEPSNPNAKRKVALLVAYNGAPYQGLQKNPGATTIEEVLEAAIHRAGGITDDNFGTLQKVSWSRAGRTDKGVHAVGQVIGLKCVLSPEPMLDRINAELAGSEVSVLGLERATQGFCAHTMCSSREYEYLLPVYALRPEAAAAAAAAADEATAPAAETTAAAAASASAEAPLASAAADVPAGEAGLSEEEAVRLRALLDQLVGTHPFHNFTDVHKLGCDKHGEKLGYDARAATRFVKAIDVGAPQTHGGVCFVPLHFHGQSFLLHQIRKMVAIVAACMRGAAPPDAIQTALREPRVPTIPLAPGGALTLLRCWYAPYEKHRPAGRGSIHFEGCAAQQQAFLHDVIHPAIAAREAAGEFRAFCRELDRWDITAPLAPAAAAPPAAAIAGTGASADQL